MKCKPSFFYSFSDKKKKPVGVGVGVGVASAIIVLLLAVLVWLDITRFHYCLPWKVSKCKEMINKPGNRKVRD